MVVLRTSVLSGSFGRTVFRRAGAQARSRSWRQVGRRSYASGHGEQQSSELPWIIGSVAVTIPAAGWLLQQGPKKGDHGHGHDAHAEEHQEEGEEKEESEEKEEQPEEDAKDDSEEKSEEKTEEKTEQKSDDDKDDEPKEEKSDDAGDDSDESADSKDQGSDSDAGSDDDSEKPGPNAPKQINWHSGMSKGPGEGQKGDRKPTERKGEKDAQGTFSGAKHPYIDDPEKSKKGVGVTETARIHGTVDSRTGARGVGSTGDSSD